MRQNGMKHFVSTLVLLFFALAVHGQKITVSGTVVDQEGEALPAATVQLLKTDSTQATGMQAKDDGTFALPSVKAGAYILKVSFVGYTTVTRDLTLTKDNKKMDVGRITLTDNARLLKEAEVTARVAQVEMKEDTFVYNSAAFRVPEGSNLEALVRKLPGVEVGDDGTIKVNGKEVKKIMVDGKEFFGDDKEMSMKNLPAKMVDKIKAYDKQSDYSKMTGIDDGEEQTVIDLTVKKGMKEGWLLNLDGAYGTEQRFTEKLNLNRFTDHSQFSLMGSYNNVGNRGWGGWGGGGGGETTNGMAGATFAWENGKGEDDAGYFEVGGNVRYGYNKNYTVNKSNSESFLTSSASQFVNSLSESNSRSWNINTDFRLEWQPDTLTNILFRPNFGYNDNSNSSNSSSVTFNDSPYDAGMDAPLTDYQQYLQTDPVTGQTVSTLSPNILVNDNLRASSGSGNSYNVGGSLQANRRLGKAGRNITLDVSASTNSSKSESDNLSKIRYFQAGSTGDTLTNQFNNNPSSSWNYRVRLSYTEPIFKGGNLEMSYQFNRRFSDSDRSMYSLGNLYYDPTLRQQYFGDYSDAEVLERLVLGYRPGGDTLTSTLDLRNSQYATYNEYNHEANIMLRYNVGDLQLNGGLSFQPQTTYMDYKKNELDTSVVRNVFNWAPRFRVRWKISNTSQINFNYNGRMSQPSMTNLLPITDYSDPMNVSMGNPGLKPSWTNSARLFYNDYITDKQMGWTVHLNWSQTSNSISNMTTYDLETGKRTTRPENINGNWNTGAFLMFNTAVDRQKYFNLYNHVNFNYSNNVGYVSVGTGDNVKSTTKTTNIGDNLRFNFRNDLVEVGVNGGFNYQHARNGIRTSANLDTWSFNYGANFQINCPWGMTFATDISQQSRRGYDDASMNTNELIWNASLQQSFLKQKNLHLSVEWFDILGQRSNISRSISATQRSDSWTNAINSYLMVHIIYELNLLGSREARMNGWGGGPGGWGGPGGGGDRGRGGGGGPGGGGRRL